MADSPKVVLFCPVREHPEVLQEALNSHRQLAGVSERWYFDDCDDAASSALLKGEIHLPVEFVVANGGRPVYDRESHTWNGALTSRVAAIKDAAIDAFLQTGADALLLIDSDVLPHPQMVQHLLSLKLPIVSEVFWSQWQPGTPWLPNVWDEHHYEFEKSESILRLAAAGQYQVGGLGACTLIRRDALKAGARFESVPGVGYWGEDRHFCIRAAALGVPLFVDTTYPAFHVYRELMLDEARLWKMQGCQAEYFRSCWLTPEWEAAIVKTPTPTKPRTIAVCLPGESFSSKWVRAWSDLIEHLTSCGRWNVRKVNGYSSNPHITRQGMANAVCADPANPELVLWIDDDQLLLPEQFDRLVADLDALPELGVVAAWSWCDREVSDPPMPPCISAGILDEDGTSTRHIPLVELMKAAGLIHVTWTGFPAVLMRAEVLRTLGKRAFAPLPAPNAQWGFAGEDVSFSVRAAAAGFQMAVDPRVYVPHLKDRALGLGGDAVTDRVAVEQARAMLAGRVSVQEMDEPALSNAAD